MDSSDMGAEHTVPAQTKAPIGWGLLLLLIVVIGGSVLGATQMLARVGRSDEAVRAEVAPVVERYRALTAAGDADALADWLDPAADPTWRERVLTTPTAVALPFTSVQLGKIGTLDENTADVYQVELRGTFEQDGISVPAYAYIFFRRANDARLLAAEERRPALSAGRRANGEWLPTFPVADEHWGPAKSFDSNGVILTYRVEESQEILTAMTEVAALNRRLESFDTSLNVPSLSVEIDPVMPIHGPTIERNGEDVTIRLRSPSVGWGAVEPTTHLRAQYAHALLDVLPASSDAYVRAGRRALARYWIGQLNQAHPLFDTALIATARPMVMQDRWPELVSVLSGDSTLRGEERDVALTTAYLWLLSEGMDASDLHGLLQDRGNGQAIEERLTEALKMPPAEVEAAWQHASRVRYAPD